MRTLKSFSVNIFILILFVSCLSCNFAPGSYPYAEEYELDYPEEQVIAAINQFKKDHPTFIVPKVTINNQGSWSLNDEQTKDPAYWYQVYFYYKNENKIIFTWTRPSGRNKTTFALVSINEGLDIGNWKDINKDFSHDKNKSEKKKFEEQILNRIKDRLKQ